MGARANVLVRIISRRNFHEISKENFSFLSGYFPPDHNTDSKDDDEKNSHENRILIPYAVSEERYEIIDCADDNDNKDPEQFFFSIVYFSLFYDLYI